MFSLLFVKEYLSDWTNFLQDILKVVTGPDLVSGNFTNSAGIHMYLLILMEIDTEVVNRTFKKSEEVGLEFVNALWVKVMKC